MTKITVQQTEIAVIRIQGNDYISLTDMANAKESESRAADIIKNWLRNRYTIEFLGTWEQIHNPHFKVVEFDHFALQAGLPQFVMSVMKNHQSKLEQLIARLCPYRLKMLIQKHIVFFQETNNRMNKAPKLTNIQDKLKYLEKHIINDLHWLVRAAYEWVIQDKIELGVNGYHMQVFAMDSVFMRSRALFEFLTRDNSKLENRYFYTVLDFGLSKPLKSEMYKKWTDQIHSHTGIHLQDRTNTNELTTKEENNKELNKMPAEFAKEVIRLWQEFINNLNEPDLKGIARQGLEDVLKEAEQVINSIKDNRRGSLYQNIDTNQIRTITCLVNHITSK